MIMKNTAILVLDTIHQDLLQVLLKHNFKLTEAYSWDREKLILEIKNYSGLIIRSRLTIDKTIIDAASNLKFIARYGAGMENIDVAYATGKNIKCLHAAAGNKDAVAEHALGMLLALMNNIPRADQEVRQYQWLRETNRGEELSGKTVGIIGYGNMGSAFAKRLQGFNVKVLVYDKYKTNYISQESWIKESTLEQIFAESDVLSLHTPLTSETNNMVNYKWLLNFKKPIYLINTSRGKVLNTADTLKLVEENRIKGLCLDVLEYEDTSFEQLKSAGNNPDIEKLFQSGKVILTPHIAGWSRQSHWKLAQVLGQEIILFWESNML